MVAATAGETTCRPGCLDSHIGEHDNLPFTHQCRSFASWPEQQLSSRGNALTKKSRTLPLSSFRRCAVVATAMTSSFFNCGTAAHAAAVTASSTSNVCQSNATLYLAASRVDPNSWGVFTTSSYQAGDTLQLPVEGVSVPANLRNRSFLVFA